MELGPDYLVKLRSAIPTQTSKLTYDPPDLSGQIDDIIIVSL